MKSVLLATTNKGKAREFIRLLSAFGIDVIIPEESVDIHEGECSFLENAYMKAKGYYERYKIPTLADDSGLVVPSLEGFPGVFSSRFYMHPYGGTQEPEGSVDDANIKKVLRLMEGKEDRRAYFVCYVVLYTGDGGYFAEGRVHGQILPQPRGTLGFGYDPIFLPDGYTLSMAEMKPEEKDKISHRGKALRKLMEVVGWK